jgi:hypothetical protein
MRETGSVKSFKRTPPPSALSLAPYLWRQARDTPADVTIYLGAGALGPIAYGTIGDAWSLPMVFFAMALASLALVPLTGLYHLSRTAVVS